MSALAARMSAELGARVVSRLVALEAASRGLRAPGELARIRTDLLAVLRMWQRLLTAHAPVGERGRCPRCRSWWDRRRGPCRVWTAAHTMLVTLDYPARPTVALTSSSNRRPGFALSQQVGASASGPAGMTIISRDTRPGSWITREPATGGPPVVVWQKQT